MNKKEMIAYKMMLQRKCISIIEERITAAFTAMENAQASANNEEKSSAGDKYETGRAMNQLEKDMCASQLASHRKDMAALLSVDCNVICDTIKPGSIVACNDASFFIAAGLGKTIIEEQTVFLLSPNAPLAVILYNKKTGDSFSFMKKELIIKKVF